MYLSPAIREQYKRKINNFISDYRISEYEDGDGNMNNYDVLEDAYNDCYESVDNIFKEAMQTAFYYGLAIGLEKPKIIKNE